MDTFLSTPSARRATPPAAAPVSSMSDFYPRPPRGGRPLRLAPQPAYRSHFYPRPPRGGRQRGGAVLRLGDKFLSTPSARRATQSPRWFSNQLVNFYPRPPRGGRRQRYGDRILWQYISIHALREEGDSKNRDKISIFKQIIQHSARI